MHTKSANAGAKTVIGDGLSGQAARFAIPQEKSPNIFASVMMSPIARPMQPNLKKTGSNWPAPFNGKIPGYRRLKSG